MIFRTILVLFIILLSGPSFSAPKWVDYMEGAVSVILKGAPGEYGIYIKSYRDGAEYSYNDQEKFYYASTIKMFVLLEAMFAENSGKLDLKSYHTIRESDFRDGSGLSRTHKRGARIQLGDLVQNMIMHSDNLATDVLIEKVGLTNLNQRIQELSEKQIGPITTMLQVRQEMYGYLDPKGKELAGLDYFNIRKVFSTRVRLNAFAKAVGKKPGTFTNANWNDATDRFYQTGVNSGPVKAYASLLDQLVKASTIPKAVSDRVFFYLYKTQTGKSRIRKSLPKNVKWAHKTGTQAGRACDMGVAGRGEKKEVLIAICAKNFGKTSNAENKMARISLALRRSGVFE